MIDPTILDVVAILNLPIYVIVTLWDMLCSLHYP